MLTRSALFAFTLGAAVAAAPFAATAGSRQGQPPTDGAARAGSNAGSSAVTPTRAPTSTPRAKHPRKAAATHRPPTGDAGMGSQGANTTGPTSNSH